MPVHEITVYELKEWIISEKKDYIVVDVRDADFEGGNIAKAINIPSVEFKANLSRHVHDLSKLAKNIIFHCMLSQVRGPSCALKFMSYAEELGLTGNNVYVLKGGFVMWEREFGRDRNLTEAYNEAFWEDQREYI